MQTGRNIDSRTDKNIGRKRLIQLIVGLTDWLTDTQSDRQIDRYITIQTHRQADI